MVNSSTGRSCTKCGAWKPFAEFYRRNGKPIARCKDCVRAKSRENYGSNREARLESSRKWREANQSQHRENARRWYAENPDRAKASRKRYYEANQEKHRQYVRASYAKHREIRIAQIAAYRKANAERFREIHRLQSSRRRARISNALVIPFTDDQLRQRIAYYGGKCWICRVAPYEHIDHVKPISRGGAHILSNLRPACAACNQRKHATWQPPPRKEIAS